MEKAVNELEMAFTGMNYECDVKEVANKIIGFRTQQMGFLFATGVALLIIAIIAIKIIERKRKQELLELISDPEIEKELQENGKAYLKFAGFKSGMFFAYFWLILALVLIIVGMKYFEYRAVPESALLDYIKFR